MKATTSSDNTSITHDLAYTGDGQNDTIALQNSEAQPQAENKAANRGKADSELRAAARRHGYTVKELAAKMCVNYSHLCSVANGRRPWTPDLRGKAMAVLGEVPGQGVVYREGGRVSGSESNYIREQSREVGLSMGNWRSGWASHAATCPRRHEETADSVPKSRRGWRRSCKPR